MSGAPPRDWTIRSAQRPDLDDLERLENAVFDSDRLSRRNLAYHIGSPATDTPVAATPAAVVGYAMIGFRRSSAYGRIFSLAVAPEYARQGVGRALLEACEAHARARGRARVRLEVRQDNESAIALYERAGYRSIGQETDYYEDGATALKFEKRLSDAERA